MTLGKTRSLARLFSVVYSESGSTRLGRNYKKLWSLFAGKWTTSLTQTIAFAKFSPSR